MKMKLNAYILLPLILIACSNSDGSPSDNGGGSNTGAVIVNGITADLSLEMKTDKACYKPGEPVTFSVEGSLPLGAKVRYRHGNDVISYADITNNTWTWTPPTTDFTGYLADIYTQKDNTSQTVYGTIAVDVSSDWTAFPRYGFVASYDASKTSDVIANEMSFLSRCHINGIQFYDWQNKHHWPLGGTRDQLQTTYKDIANRNTYTSVIKDYISQQHKLGMKCMFYNLCYGALSDASRDGVQDQWYLYKDGNHQNKDVLTLPSSWKSSIYLMDPSNKDWQNYISERNDDVYANLDFDGYHIDQVGDRGSVYNYDGTKVDLPSGFGSFITAIKAKHPDRRLVMNAVSSFGTKEIASTNDVDFLYNELWDSQKQFNDIYSIISANNQNSNNTRKTVLAAYMNYNLSSGNFNIPGVLMADAVMFGLGGDHLELGGDHMLCNEYFPNSKLAMSELLKTYIIRYYDFATAYQNLLRGEGTETTLDISSSNSDAIINVWPPKLKGITSYSRVVDGKQVISLFNFIKAKDLMWRDADGTAPLPKILNDVQLTIKLSNKVNKIWAATPDAIAGAPVELSFKQSNGVVTFTLPYLKYWTMIVIE